LAYSPLITPMLSSQFSASLAPLLWAPQRAVSPVLLIIKSRRLHCSYSLNNASDYRANGRTDYRVAISYTHDTRSRNRRPKSTQFFRRRFLVRVSCKSGTGFFWYRIPAPNRTLFYSKPETGLHMTKMIIYHRLLFILSLPVSKM